MSNLCVQLRPARQRLSQTACVIVLPAAFLRLQEMEAAVPAKVRRRLAALKPDLYVVDARAVADAVGLGKRINMVMQTGG